MPSAAAALRARASVFAALGDETRLGLLARLTNGEPQSISRLTSGTRLTRQAVTKHLRVLEGAGVVHSVKTIIDAQTYLEHVSRQWDNALARLKALVEEQ